MSSDDPLSYLIDDFILSSDEKLILNVDESFWIFNQI